MNVNIQEEAEFYEFVKKLAMETKQKLGISRNKWLSPEDAMQILGITSTIQLHELKDKSLIRFTQPLPGLTLYDSDSIDLYLEKHTHNTF